jgi:hypothetical protein
MFLVLTNIKESVHNNCTVFLSKKYILALFAASKTLNPCKTVCSGGHCCDSSIACLARRVEKMG